MENRQTNKSKPKSTSNSAYITLTYLTFVHTLPFRYLRCRAAFEDQTKIKKKISPFTKQTESGNV